MTLEMFRKTLIRRGPRKILYIEGEWILYKRIKNIHLFHLPCGRYYTSHPHLKKICKESPPSYIENLYKLMNFTEKIM